MSGQLKLKPQLPTDTRQAAVFLTAAVAAMAATTAFVQTTVAFMTTYVCALAATNPIS